ncbi:MAG TPA: HK97 family phage prohead protease [Armatimonadota bacterium]|jgi:hypothetical protein
MPKPTLEYKEFEIELKALNADNGGFSGYASTFGNVDRVGDIMLTGAFAATLAAFLTDGSICWNHEQEDQIGYILEAHEDEVGLWIETAYHSTDEAQEKRTIVNERLAAGKTVKLSVGYVVEDCTYNADGNRLLKQVALYEVSIVTIPANNEAGIVDAKSLESAAGTAAPESVEDPDLGRKALAREILNRYLDIRLRLIGA